MADEYRYLFGPVPSRRLGKSLGIDLVPFKVCTYDCVYCQLGRTTDKTSVRGEYVPVAEVIGELEKKVKSGVAFDYLTLSGSGEPTLNTGVGEVIAAARRLSDRPVALITNGSLLWREDVRREAAEADLVIPSLDAGSDALYRYVNRPAADIPFQTMVEGLVAFSVPRPERIWLEVFLLDGVNTTVKDIRLLNEIVRRINPSRVQVNTVQRPPAESFATAVPGPLLRELALMFDGRVEIIADFNRPAHTSSGAGRNSKQEIVALLRRRPCTVDDITGSLGVHRHEVLKRLDELEEAGMLIVERRGQDAYYEVERPKVEEGA